jgi:hypothetical protein
MWKELPGWATVIFLVMQDLLARFDIFFNFIVSFTVTMACCLIYKIIRDRDFTITKWHKPERSDATGM